MKNVVINRTRLWMDYAAGIFGFMKNTDSTYIQQEPKSESGRRAQSHFEVMRHRRIFY